MTHMLIFCHRCLSAEVAGPDALCVRRHWGLDSNGKMAPNSNGTCTVASFEMEYDLAWGWDDTTCTQEHVYICKQMRKSRRCAPCARPADPAPLPTVCATRRSA